MKNNNYKYYFNISALILFALIMLPNLIWMLVPSQNDVLRRESSTQVLDAFTMIFQIISVATLCAIKNIKATKLKLSPFIFLTLIFGLLYYIFWILYYCGIVHSAVLLGLCIFPCCAFIFYGVDRKNYFSLAPIAIFAILHLISTIINFL